MQSAPKEGSLGSWERKGCGHLTPRVGIRETALPERSPTWARPHLTPGCPHAMRHSGQVSRVWDPVLGYPFLPACFPGPGSGWGCCPRCPSTHPQALSLMLPHTREHAPGSVCSAPLLILLYLTKRTGARSGVLLHRAAGFMRQAAAGRAVFHFFCVGGMTQMLLLCTTDSVTHTCRL